VDGTNDDLLVPEGIWDPTFYLVFVGFCIQNNGGEVKFFNEFQCPLLAERRWANYQNISFSFGPVLT
jgi:hypothetical protein